MSDARRQIAGGNAELGRLVALSATLAVSAGCQLFVSRGDACRADVNCPDAQRCCRGVCRIACASAGDELAADGSAGGDADGQPLGDPTGDPAGDAPGDPSDDAAGDAGDDAGGEPQPGCPTGEERCTLDVRERCTGVLWETVEDCDLGDSVCEVTAWDPTLTFCRHYAAELEPCTGSGQGDCVGGLSCRDLSSISINASICVTDCSAEPTACAATSRTCDGSLQWCLGPQALLDEPCGLNGDSCPSGMSCEVLGSSSDVEYGGYYCQQPCAPELINTGIASCIGGSECLASPLWELQSPSPVSCLIPGSEDPPCNGGAGFACTLFNRFIDPALYCARPFGRCGLAAPNLPVYTESTIFDWVATDANLCGPPFPSRLCRPDTTATAAASCEAMPWYFADSPPTTCTSDADCAFVTGQSCLLFGSENFCGTQVSACVLFCDPPVAGGPDRSCPAPLTCQRIPGDCNPADTLCMAKGNRSLFPYPELELRSGDLQPCSIFTDCDQSAPLVEDRFRCMDLGSIDYSARPHKVCASP